MLPYILALVVAVGSLALYLSAFFFPETYRKGDIIFSGVGLFYALVLWVCAHRFTGAVLLGQTASVALLTWLGWQTLTLRRELVPSDRRTVLGPKTIQQGLGRLLRGLMKLPGDLVRVFSRSKPAPVSPSTPVPAAEAAPTAPPTGTEEVPVAPEGVDEVTPAEGEEPLIAPHPQADIASVPPTPEEPTAIVETESITSPEPEEPEAPEVVATPEAEMTPAPELPELEAPAAAETSELEMAAAAETGEMAETGEPGVEEAQPGAERTPQTPTQPKRENILTVLKEALVALSPFKKRPSRPMITLNRPEAQGDTTAETKAEAAIEPEIETEGEAEVKAEADAAIEALAEPAIEPAIEPASEPEVTPDGQVATESEGDAIAQDCQGSIAEVEQDQSEIEDWEAEPSPAVANTMDALSEETLSEEALPGSHEAEVTGSDASALETPGEADLGPDGAAAITVSSEVEVAQSDLDVIDEPVPEPAIEVEARVVSNTDDEEDAGIGKANDEGPDEVTSKAESDRDRESRPETSL
ncbi:Ycf66 family protein [Trichothermofontia sp.]